MKWRAAAAGALTLALLAGGFGAGVAHAAPGDPINPQSNGSKGSFFLYDANTGEFADGDTARVYTRDEALISSASATNVSAEINPSATRPVTGGTAFTQVWRFISDKEPAKVAGGFNTWKVWASEAAAGQNGGTKMADFTLDAFGPQVDAVIAAGGSYWYGVAYTSNAGVVTVGAVYREINITAGSGNYTVGAVEVEEGPSAPTVTQQPANASVDLGATATFTAASSDAAASVQWQSSSDGTTWADVDGATSATLTLANVSAAQNGTQYHAVFTNADGSATTDAATLTVTGPVEPQAGDPNEVTIPAPAEGATSITVPAGAANANKTFTVWAWSDRTNLGQVTTDADGNATVDVSSLGVGEHTIALAESDFSIKAWGAVTLASLTTTKTDLAVDVTTSNKFELQGVASSADLGQVQRGQTSAPVALGAFTVVDDRALLPGWTLTTAVDDFTNASADNDVVSKSALGLAPAAVSDLPVGVSLGTAQTAGSGEYPALFAQGAEDSSTLEAGTQLNADLSFAAPASAKAGTYSSTLTLSLVSK